MSKRFHIFISVFFLPVLLVYVVTGLMFLAGQRSRGQLEELLIEAPWPGDQAGQLALAKSVLAGRGRERTPPDRFKSYPDFFFWGHSGAFSLALAPGPAEGLVEVKMYEPTVYSRLMSLHANRARGGWFQGLALLFSLGWLLSYFGVIFRKSKRRTRWRLLSFGAGLLVTLIICWAAI